MARLVAGCGACPALYWMEERAMGSRCPACGAAELAEAPEVDVPSPELMTPSATRRDSLGDRLADFARGPWFPTAELDAAVLLGRMVPMWWPRWLVDAELTGIWEAEAGFDYEVESSQERFGNGRWNTLAVTETRIRWESRLGRITRHYPNVDVDALSEQDRLDRLVGRPDRGTTQPWTDGVQGAVRLPDLAATDQWPVALTHIRRAAGTDCASACDAQHIRNVVLDVDAEQARWSLWLVPGWVTWYADDEGQRRMVYVNGVTGQVGGPRLASPAKGRRVAILCVGIAVGCATVGIGIGLLGIVLWPLLAVAGVLLALSLVLGCAALWPWLQPRSHNAAELRRVAGP